MAYPTVGATTIANGVTTVDCQKQVRSWRLLRSLMELLIPSYGCTIIEDRENYLQNYSNPQYPTFTSSNAVIGTLFGYRRGKVRLCIQTSSKPPTNPILPPELAVPTTTLAREMRGGVLRIALECASATPACSLLSMPVWTMHVLQWEESWVCV
jgi:hypothetical protein